ncbi:MAG: phosphatidylserine/phosphatidylglycerophosphate/cardiolipin synthase family protein [Woeseiaceae bacterium]|nr:phosphatidylserine/phosphatidylglycerophosphate/cardiolipin synthase family protein [Woeseiaceae bacterium]
MLRRYIAGLIAILLLAGCASTDGTARPQNTQLKYAQATGHIARSHTTGLLTRPFSATFRLAFVLVNTVTTSLRPAYPKQLGSGPPPSLNGGPGMDLAEWELYLDETTRKASSGTMELLVDGDEFFPRFIAAVNDAQVSIDLRTYIFDDDDFAVEIGRLLRQRADEGIDTKVLVDGFGTIIATIEQQENLPPEHEPPPSVRRFLEVDSALEVRQAQNPWFTGDHVKTVIIDGKTAFTGGMNFAREYRYDWHDLMVELRGPVVGVLQHEFDKAWAHAGPLGDLAWLNRALAGRSSGDTVVGYPIRTLFTRTENAEIYRVQRKAIQRAQKYIFVQNPYYTDDVMLYELARARRRGVDVRVIIPLETDRGLITRNNVLAANELLEHGVRIYIYPGMSHVKAAIYDDWACLGSANWDRWSFYLNKELNVATSDSSAVEALRERVFESDFEASVELTEPIPERWTDYLYEVFGDYFF